MAGPVLGLPAWPPPAGRVDSAGVGGVGLGCRVLLPGPRGRSPPARLAWCPFVGVVPWGTLVGLPGLGVATAGGWGSDRGWVGADRRVTLVSVSSGDVHW